MNKIRADFLRNSRGDAFIRFFDPAYVRADVVLLDRESKTLYAVMHEQEHEIGKLDDDMAALFSENDDVHLTAEHYHSGAVNLKAPLVIAESAKTA